jgi:hypothetical protein
LPSHRIIGAFLFPEVFKDLASFGSTLQFLRDRGVNAILTETQNYEAAVVDRAHDLGLRFYAGIACFSDHATRFQRLAQRPELWPILESGERRPQMEWYVGMSPADRGHQKEILAAISSIATDNPIDGLFLDFVRWPLHWEIELRPGRPLPPDSSFDDGTLNQFIKATGIVPALLDSPRSRAAWIRAHHLREWIDFKCKVITDFVSEARVALKAARPGAELGIYVVPDIDGLTESLTGQRIIDLVPLVDWVAPMLYHNILLRPPSWIGQSLTDSMRVAGRKTLPILQVDSNRDPTVEADWGPPMSVADWQAALAEVTSRSDVAGLVAFPGTSLVGDGRGEVLAAMLSELQ